MRGKDHFFLFLCQRHRITPAYAGKSYLITSDGFGDGDHPRLCGEKKLRGSNAISHRGSPPPMRGKVSFRSANSFSLRITPAYAGKRTMPHGFAEKF